MLLNISDKTDDLSKGCYSLINKKGIKVDQVLFMSRLSLEKNC